MCKRYQKSINADILDFLEIVKVIEKYATDEGLNISEIVLTQKPDFAIEENKQESFYDSPLLSDFEYVHQYRNGGFTGDEFEGYVAVKASDQDFYFMYWYQC